MSELITKFGVIEIHSHKDIFSSLVYSIIEQQLSSKAATTIYNRFLSLFPNGKFTPEKIINLELIQLRNIGTSWAKARSLHDLSQKIINKTLILENLPNMSDEEVFNHLIQVKGIGPWSAQMQLMFTLNRPDIFPLEDVGIQNAFVKLFGLNRKHKSLKTKMLKIANKWRPYRTLACRYLWVSLDNQS
jgi:DNA-3-methyladenine glycosylase II